MASIAALQKQVENAVRVRNALVIAIIALVLALISMTFALSSKSKEIVIVPSVVDEMNITASRVPDDYILALTHDLVNLLLNRHPHDTEYFRTNVLRMVHPRFHNSIVSQIEYDEENNKFKSGTRVFRPLVICRVRSSGIQTEAVGDVEVYINGSRISSERVAYRYIWQHEGFHVRVSDIRQIPHEDSKCANEKG